MAGSIGVFMHCFTLARRIGCVSIVMATFLSSPPLRAETRAASTQSVEGASAAPFVAQVVNPDYFYTIGSKYKREWRELAGVHVELALPAGRLDPEGAGAFLRDEMVNMYEIGNPSAKNLWIRDTPPDVHVTSGHGNAGFTSLNAALDYLAAHPDKS
ncbi:hypothetical protein KPA97_07500, partial [Burkholderia cenocepacia]|nr:hypothetical protein [Burkholderia cenocepacia]